MSFSDILLNLIRRDEARAIAGREFDDTMAPVASRVVGVE